MDLESNARLEGEASLLSWQGSHDQSSYSVYPDLFHECVQIAYWTMQGYRSYDQKVLVGARRSKENPLGEVEHFVYFKVNEVWGLGIYNNSIMPYWQSRSGDCSIKRKPYCTRFSKLNSFLKAVSLMLLCCQSVLLMHGGAFYKQGRLFRKGPFGGLIMVLPLKSRIISGYWICPTTKFYL